MNKQPEITTDNFAGPLELLLKLLKKERLMITDVSLVAITDQYLSYLKRASEINLPLVGEYYILATTLMTMKSQALLPILEVDDDDQEDDASILVARLKEYERYRQVTSQFKQLEQNGQEHYTIAPLMPPKLKPQLIIPAITSKQDLKTSYVYLLNKNNQTHKVPKIRNTWRYSIDTQTGLIRKKLLTAGSFLFHSLIADNDRQEIVTNFLAVLNMAKDGELLINQQTQDELIIKRGGSHGN
ncbi:ScpA B protein [Lentilactobacillus senioris DSM 24302 = JCM 17472]|uniref:Segregation and condensation protein A n=1 Tax=Lentilactobacillus senioris DSM 24302 = JCM 17472 TaxID=1423802 RepID=A0A0R2D066_9LACO|nr:segregation/condensation protein A [Lentilactobacillus senioris]KRM93801.1 ScpA B protein [Lentilactobacillus senioris DSM 24302 = JCM 17472]